MKRDCGEGKLIPVKFTLVWTIGKSDKEHKKTVELSSEEFCVTLSALPAFSSVRMYAWDKEGYANCIRSACVDKEGKIKHITDRLSEL